MAIHLSDFRKIDYPGESVAMAYESDVTVVFEDGRAEQQTISMNKPLEHAGWKVYQSSFIGDTVSIFSVMRDPGLRWTYLGCIGLCVGIVVTFYSRRFSRPHPGMATGVHASNPRSLVDAGDAGPEGDSP